MNLYIVLLGSLCYVQVCKCTEDSVKKAKNYLLKFGYLDRFSVGDEELKDSITRLQYFANLKTTGKLDAATLKQMTLPRCALADPKIKIKRERRYVHQGTKWRKSMLTWRLKGRGRTLNRGTIRKVMMKAMSFWSDISTINFKETASSQPDIWVMFARYHHGDPYSFDGEGQTLAHAFYPHNNKGLSGDVHFDDDEYYTYQSPRGKNLLWVATHELGHSLGLEHSNVREAVMYPWYTKYKPGFKLHSDDVLGIQMLYGSKPRSTKRPFGTTIPRKDCPKSNITAIFYNRHAKRMVVSTVDEKLYFLDDDGIKYGPLAAKNYYPKSKIPGAIDSAFSTKIIGNEDRTIIFSGKNYYIFRSFRFISGPHSIHGNRDNNPLNLEFPSWVKNIDAAMTWQRNQKIYFFAGQYYWRYNDQKKSLDGGYPRRITSAWKNSPTTIDSVYSSSDDKKTFFISGNKYYLFNDRYVRVKRGYPEHIGRQWLKCGDRTSMASGNAAGGLAVGSISVSEVAENSGDEP